MADTPRRHTAGLFDIRNIIGALLGIYGVVLLLDGIFGTSAAEKAKAGGNADLWVGIGLVIVAVLLLAWAKVRPTVVDEAELEKDKVAQEQEGAPGAAAG